MMAGSVRLQKTEPSDGPDFGGSRKRTAGKHNSQEDELGSDDGHCQDTRPVPTLLTLLQLDPRDRAGLIWIRNRSRFLLTLLERQGKGSPQGEPCSAQEARAIKVVVVLGEAAGVLLGAIDTAERSGP